MTVLNAGAVAPTPDFAVPSRLETFCRTAAFDRPTLVLDVDRMEAQYHALKTGLGRADIHYAVKANPHPALLRRLVQLGANFDAASTGEIAQCLEAGATPDRISFGNTIKRARDIAWAHERGITLFAADAEEELEKIAAHAPGAQVYVRVIVEQSMADWPLTRKFGCDAGTALHLLDAAKGLGLEPLGLSFHVGSQTRQSAMWAPTLDAVAALWTRAREAGHALTLLNIGGGFPAFYGEPIEAPTDYAAGVMAMVHERFGHVPRIMAEPGRGLVAEAGMIVAEVVLTSRKSERDLHRWVYLSVGRFSGLAETEGEAIRYQFLTDRDGDPTGPCIVAGPSCDSADVLYEKRPVQLPLTLRAGDRVLIRNTGAYTSTYSSVCFNGFPPLDVVAI
ncbi:Diaminopimelate decarboxylase [Rubellimicrobium thermophilum DSM 16684]|uniref:ornithine decarboxylase n=1 Tax=Rubellimicrobium thermophilum DSM 16684 TaxID=1123069 RepID=S9R375_9RHOB|nr:type III PLP-dependent enzyme [Rubellimicrobium thermophilum]EPX86372.1 Diaminopimelate decarboxylase [Rubellimicrobium thermophilum DSM 16684]